MDNIIIRDLNARIDKLEKIVTAYSELLNKQMEIITALTNNVDKLADRVNTNTRTIDVVDDNTTHEINRVWKYLRGE